MCPLMGTYIQIRRYGTILHDSESKSLMGYQRYMKIHYNGTKYAISMLNGDVLKIEVLT